MPDIISGRQDINLSLSLYEQRLSYFPASQIQSRFAETFKEHGK